MRATAEQILRASATIFGAALAMGAWSELVFVNAAVAVPLLDALERGVGDAVLSPLVLGAFYAIAGLFLYGLVGLAGAAGPARVMLIGAMTGFAIEGALVNAVYEAVPFSYLWTSIAWHGPITVALGVFAMPRLLSTASLPRLLLLLTLLGLAWGLWAPWTWSTDEMPPMEPVTFFRFALVSTGVMAAGYALMWFGHWPKARLSRPMALAMMAPVGVLLVMQGIQVPLAGLGLAAILAVVAAVLWRLGFGVRESDPPGWRRLVWLLLLPVIASATYAVQWESGPVLIAEDLVALTFILGMSVWVYGLARGLWRARKGGV